MSEGFDVPILGVSIERERYNFLLLSLYLGNTSGQKPWPQDDLDIWT